ncbi:hypothetical protein PF010_g28483 [Phytophthora fragariae]|uniref:Uncharacterized protein n=1 Tax=Phytophthora fragariae TaxID=53985 RepID=A0A6G0JRU2_9STRA|nr:hypothetical protein PF010_g28483 [Phytophthora fragariae]
MCYEIYTEGNKPVTDPEDASSLWIGADCRECSQSISRQSAPALTMPTQWRAHVWMYQHLK